MPLIVLFLLVVFIFDCSLYSIKIVPQSNIYVVERLGKILCCMGNWCTLLVSVFGSGCKASFHQGTGCRL